jgi:hypothetical protein
LTAADFGRTLALDIDKEVPLNTPPDSFEPSGFGSTASLEGTL